jgi:hypothetical protein
MSVPTTRRTVASMDARRAQAVKLIEELRDHAAADAEQIPLGRDYYKGQEAGLRSALEMVRWAFGSEQDWMFDAR